MSFLSATLAGLIFKTKSTPKNLEISNLQQSKVEVERRYVELYEQQAEVHEEELERFDNYIKQLDADYKAKKEQLENQRGVCLEIPVPNRPCYCPAYIDVETGKTIDDANGRECYLCNTDSGEWEYRGDLCTVSCSRCVVCNDGIEVCDTITEQPNRARDICVKARNKALARCAEVEPEERLCDYPKPPCEVTGPHPAAGFSYEVRETTGDMVIMQGGQASLPSNNGVVARVGFRANSDVQPGEYEILINRLQTQINSSGEQPYAIENGTIIVGSGEITPDFDNPPVIDGNTKSVGGTISLDASKCFDNDSNPLVVYRWWADQVALRDPQNGNYIDTQELTLTSDMVGKYIQGGVALQQAQSSETFPDTKFSKSAPYGLIEAVPEPYAGAVRISANNAYEVRNAIVADYSDFFAYRPDIDPIGISWIELVSGQSYGAENFLYLGPWAAGLRFYPVINYLDEAQEQQTASGPISPAISASDPPESEPSEDPFVGNATVTGELTEGSTLGCDYDYTSPDGYSAGPFFQWYKDNEVHFGFREQTYETRAKDVGSVFQCEVTIFDAQGLRQSWRSDPTGKIENVPEFPTGAVWILGEPRLGDTLSAFENIEDPDGIKGVIKYAWLANGARIKGAEGPTLKLLKNQNVLEKRISVVAYYTDNYDVDKEVACKFPTEPVYEEGNQLTLSVSNREGIGPNTVNYLNLNIAGPKPPKVTALQWTLSIPAELGRWVIPADGVGEAAQEGPLAEEVWDGTQIECPECWDCFESRYGNQSSVPAPLGSTYHHKCPYPGHPELTCEESQEKECKLLCEDYCYSWTWEGEEPPILSPGNQITSVVKVGNITKYVIETCVDNPDCPPNFRKGYTAIFRVDTPTWDYYECTCDNPIGPKGTVTGDTEWSESLPGAGPWNINPREREIDGWPLEPGDPGFPTFGGLPDLGCRGDFSFGGIEVCASRGSFSFIRRNTVCGGDVKPNGQRGFVIRDVFDNQSVVWHGYTMWPFTYRNKFLYQRDTPLVYGRKYNLPALAPEELPPRCVEAPTQIAYYDVDAQILFVTEEKYNEVIERLDRGDYFAPIGLTYWRLATKVFVSSDDPLYQPKVGGIPIPPLPERGLTDLPPAPVISAPRSATMFNTGSGRGITMTADVAGTTSPPDAWRFTVNKSSRDPSNQFRITSGGAIYPLSNATPVATYTLAVQAKWKTTWSKSWTVSVRIIPRPA